MEKKRLKHRNYNCIAKFIWVLLFTFGVIINFYAGGKALQLTEITMYDGIIKK